MKKKHLVYISHHFFIIANWYLPFAFFDPLWVFCSTFNRDYVANLGVGAHFSNWMQIKLHELPPPILFLHYYMHVLEQTCNLFANFSHVQTIKFFVGEDYIHFLAWWWKFNVIYYIECASVWGWKSALFSFV
jgi:hypothetical protein